VDTRRFLLVEDDEAARTYHRHVLETQGYRVLTAQHAAEAIAIARIHGPHPDLVISDVVMPGAVGLSLSRRCWRTRPEPVCVSTSPAPPTALMAPSRGDTPPHLILIKPFFISRLVARIRQILSAS
jgi:two-component system phosphate regulon response regulator OmpR